MLWKQSSIIWHKKINKLVVQSVILSKSMIISNTTATLFKTNNTNIEDTDNFCYLGNMISKDDGAFDDVIPSMEVFNLSLKSKLRL